MRILFVHNRYQHRGGEDVAVEQEADILTTKGHVVKVLIFDNNNLTGLLNKVKKGIQAIYNSHSAEEVRRLIREFNPDIIHVHNLFFTASPSILYVAHKHSIPVIFTLHNYRLICSNALLLRNNQVCELCVQKKIPLEGIKYKCYRDSATETALVTAITGIHKLRHTWQNKVTTYIALNDFAKTRLLNSSLNIPETRMVVKPNFINDPGEGALPRKDFFLFVGRLSNEKGVSIALDAFTGMPDRPLIVVGDGPEREALSSGYQQYNNITFMGNLSKQEVLAMLKECQALIFPSIWFEGLPFTILEAFATGTPVISSRLGAMEYMIHDGINGVHFIPGNSLDLQQKIDRFSNLFGPGKEAFYKAARQTYLAQYHPDVHYASISDIYQKAINKQEHR